MIRKYNCIIRENFYHSLVIFRLDTNLNRLTLGFSKERENFLGNERYDEFIKLNNN